MGQKLCLWIFMHRDQTLGADMKKMITCCAVAVILLLTVEAKNPNIIFLITDDQNRDTLGCYGGNSLTPNIDNLASGGIRFTRFTTSSPVCTPTRYTCMSGRYASRAKSLQRDFKKDEPVSIEWNTSLEPELPNIAKVLNAHGYRTGMVGKWHIGSLNEGELKQPKSITMNSKLTDSGVQEFLEKRQDHLAAGMMKNHGFDYASRIYPGRVLTSLARKVF